MSGILEHHARLRRWRRLPLGLLVLTGVLVTTLPPAAADPAPAVRDSLWAFDAANTKRLWAVSRGENAVVAVVDSGVDALHPDLRGRVRAGGDFGDGSSANGTHDVGAEKGHGTEMASLIAGTGRNYGRHGRSGLAPQATILSIGVYKNQRPDSTAVAKAIRAAVAKGADVVVIPPVEQGHPEVASAVRRAVAKNAVVVSGAGGGTQPATSSTVDPHTATALRVAEIPGVVNVAAVDRHGRVWPAGGGGKHVVVAAPGVGILAASTDGAYWEGADSAFAASWVAGLAALIRSAHPEWTAAQTIQKIIATTRAKGAGCARGCGYGVVDPVRAVTDMARPTTRTNPLLSAPAPRRSRVDPFAGVPPERILVFVVSSLGALALYVAVTTLFIWRARGRSGRFEGTGS